MGRAGFEHLAEKSTQSHTSKELSNTLPTETSIAMVQNPVHILYKHPELIQVIDLWPELPDYIKQTIMTLIRSVNNSEIIK